MAELLLLFFIFVGELGLAAIVYLAGVFTDYPKLVFFAVYGLQFFASTIQGGLSDYFCRKKSLIVGFLAICLGQVFFLLAFKHPYFLILTILLYGLLGNVTPIARAALVDTSFRNDFRMSVGLSTIAIALGWVAMMYAAYYFLPLFACILVTLFCFFSILLSFFIKDPDDLGKNRFSLKKELASIRGFLSHAWVKWGLGGYLIAEVAFYQIFARGKGQVDNPSVRFVITTWVLGYCLGVIFQKWVIPKEKERQGMLVGTCVSIISMIGLIVTTHWHFKNELMLICVNMMFAGGFGIFIPCLFSLISKKYDHHLQGKIYGLIDAVDSIALIFAVLIIDISGKFDLSYMLTSSCVLTIFALCCFLLTIKRIR